MVVMEVQENNEDARKSTVNYIVEKAKKESNKDDIIKRYKREVANLHRALNKIQKDKEQLLTENLRLKELININK